MPIIGVLYVLIAATLRFEMGNPILWEPILALMDYPEGEFWVRVIGAWALFWGLVLTPVLNALVLTRVSVGREGGEIVGAFRIDPKPANDAVFVASLGLLAMIVGGVFLDAIIS